MTQEGMQAVRPPVRPGVVTLVGILVYLWAVLAAIEAIALFFNRNDDQWIAVYGKDEIVWAAAVQAVIALALFAVGYGVLNGAKWARLAVAILVGLRLAALTWVMLVNLGQGAFTWIGLIGVAISLFILWALYGDDKSIAYYEGTAPA